MEIGKNSKWIQSTSKPVHKSTAPTVSKIKLVLSYFTPLAAGRTGRLYTMGHFWTDTLGRNETCCSSLSNCRVNHSRHVDCLFCQALTGTHRHQRGLEPPPFYPTVKKKCLLQTMNAVFTMAKDMQINAPLSMPYQIRRQHFKRIAWIWMQRLV